MEQTISKPYIPKTNQFSTQTLIFMVVLLNHRAEIWKSRQPEVTHWVCEGEELNEAMWKRKTLRSLECGTGTNHLRLLLISLYLWTSIIASFLNFYHNCILSPCYHHSLWISLVPRHNKSTRLWDPQECGTVGMAQVTRISTHQASVAFLSLPFFLLFPQLQSWPLQHFRQAHWPLPVCALPSKKHMNIDLLSRQFK